MEKVCNMDVKITAEEAKYYRRVFKFTSIQFLVSAFLLALVSAIGLVQMNYMFMVLVMLFTAYTLIIIRLEDVGTTKHLRAGLLLIGAYLFYGFTKYNMILTITIGFAVFITYINGRELQTKRKVTNKR